MSGEPALVLYSDGLLSKWGFNDGDAPDDVLNYCDRCGITVSPDGYYMPLPWHPILVQLVRRYLLPALDQAVTVAEISTIHNPIRAETVDGVNVENCWYDSHDTGPELTPESVTIPMAEIVALIPANAPP